MKVFRNSGKRISEQIAEQLREQILSGVIKQGETLAPIGDTAVELKVPIDVVMRAYNVLIDEGLISGDRKSGFYCVISKEKVK